MTVLIVTTAPPPRASSRGTAARVARTATMRLISATPSGEHFRRNTRDIASAYRQDDLGIEGEPWL